MFANLLLRFVGKVFGSKLIIGVAVAAVAAVGVLGWLNIHNLKAAAQANQQVEQIKEALAETEAELETAIAERDISIRQVLSEDPEFTDDPKLYVITDEALPGDLINELREMAFVRTIELA